MFELIRKRPWALVGTLIVFLFGLGLFATTGEKPEAATFAGPPEALPAVASPDEPAAPHANAASVIEPSAKDDSTAEATKEQPTTLSVEDLPIDTGPAPPPPRAQPRYSARQTPRASGAPSGQSMGAVKRSAPRRAAAPAPVRPGEQSGGLGLLNLYGGDSRSSGTAKSAPRTASKTAKSTARAARPAPPKRALPNTDARRPEAPHFDGDDRFAELGVLAERPVPDMTFRDYGVNPTISTDAEATSTFAVDVDTASYGVVRSYLEKGMMPDEAAVRVEEMVNAFDYAYAAPDKEPFLVQAEAFPSPNRDGYHVLHIGIKGRDLSMAERKPAALVFVVDVSGSMEGENRLGLVQRSLTMLTRQLDGRDSVAIVAYGSNARVELEPTRTTADGKRRVIDAIASLSTEGSTNVEAGLDLGYSLAGRAAGESTTTRVILCSDGVANVGSTTPEAILARVASEARRGVTISTVGFGMGTYNDVLMEQLADKGNGNYAYVDNLEAAQRVFVEQLGATLEVIAKDVKIQVEFDKKRVARYRLLGFENRMLDKRDFANDRVDAGEIGAGHTVTAIYEIKLRPGAKAGNLSTLRVRYKTPEGNHSELIERPVPVSIVRDSFANASAPTQLSVVVAGFAEKLRGSYWARNQSYRDLLTLLDAIPEGLRLRQDVAELRTLIVLANKLDRRTDRYESLLPVAKMDFDRVPVLY